MEKIGWHPGGGMAKKESRDVRVQRGAGDLGEIIIWWMRLQCKNPVWEWAEKMKEGRTRERLIPLRKG